MPERWAVALDHPEPAAVRPHHLHALVSRWLDDDHWAGSKPYSLVPLHAGSDGSPTFEVGGLVPEVGRKLAVGVAELHRRGGRLGPSRCSALSSEPLLTATAGWEQLWEDAVPLRDVALRYVTPTTFRRGDLYHPLPLPSSAVRSWNERWRRFAPEVLAKEVDLDASSKQIVIAHLDGSTAEVTRGNRTITGFVGAVTYRNYERGADGEDVGRRLGALASVAAFSGTGSSTASGFGVTDLLA